MDAATAARIASDFLSSAFSSLEAMLGAPYTFKASAPQAGADALLSRFCADCPVWMHARIAGGGAAGLSGVLAETIQTEQNAATVGKGVAELSKLMGADPTVVEASFESGGIPGRAVLVFSRELEARVAKKLDSSAIGGGVVSDEEMKDILTGFKPEDEPDRTGRRGAGGPVPENLAVIMDIELTATARLGKVEVSLADVLSYGPGSIIELGHMVDEPIELLVNGKLVARGDVVVVDERFGIRITEIMSELERIESLR